MCISNYFNDTQNKIAALRTYREHIEREMQVFVCNLTPFLNELDDYITRENQRSSKGLEIVAAIPESSSREVLLYRYRDRLSWFEIAARMNYSDRYIYKLHTKALEQFDAAESVS